MAALKKEKSAGVDNIPVELVLAGGESMSDVLTKIFNKIWKTGEWTTPWTQSLIITLQNRVAIRKYDELLTSVKKRKLRWSGHISRSSGLAKTILQSTMQGKRRKSRQKMRWEDNNKEWTGMDFAYSARAAEDRTRWKGIVVKSSVVPQRPRKVMG